MPQPIALKQPTTSQVPNTDRTTTDIHDRSPSTAGWNKKSPKPVRRSILHRHSQLEGPEPFVEANAAAEFLSYASRTVKQMAREGRIPAHPFGTGPRK